MSNHLKAMARRNVINTAKENAPAAEASEAHEEKHMNDRENLTAEPVAGWAPLALEFSIFSDTKAAEIKRSRATWGEMVNALQAPKEHISKDKCPLIKLATFGDKRTAKNALRHDDNMLAVYGIEGDYDGEEISVERAGDMLAVHGVEALIYTSPSHTDERPRWRVLAPLSKAHTPAERRRMVAMLNDALGGILSRESFTASQTYYYGRVHGAPYRFRHIQGEPIDLSLVLRETYPPEEKRPTAKPAVDEEESDLDRLAALQGVTDETIEHLRSALGKSPATGEPWIDASDYLVCIAVGEALKSLAEIGREEEARDLWLGWLAFDSSFFDGTQDMPGKWEGFNATRTDYRAVFAKAERGGWSNPWKKPKAPSAAEVIEKLRKLDADDVLATWLADAAQLGKGAAHEVVEEVARLTGKGKRILSAELAEAKAEAAQERKREQMRERAGKRQILYYRPEDRTKQAQEVEAAIIKAAKPGEYIAFGGLLSHVALKPLPYTHLIDDAEGVAPPVPQIEPLGKVAVLGMVEKVAAFCDVRDGAPAIIAVPDKIVDILIDKPEHQAPQVAGLVTHPIVLRTGEILADDGLHAGTGLFLSGAAVAGVKPYSQDEARAALLRLRADFLEGFEFYSDLDTDVAVAGLFTGVQRRVLDMAPGLGILASTQASGKTTLARRIHVLLTGRDMPVSTFPQGDEAEVQKRLLSLLLRSPAMVCFDNITDGTTFRSGSIAAAMTGPSIEQRVLGLSRDANCLTNVLFVITGNNLGLGPDEVTRWMVARLAPGTARPEERTFKHPDVVGHAVRMRAAILRDVVGIVAGYLTSGAALDTRSRFARWDHMVRQPMLWAGASDVADVFSRNTESAEHVLALESLLTGLDLAFGGKKFLAADVVAVIRSDYEFAVGEAVAVAARLAAALENLRVKDVRSTRSVGRALAGLEGRVGFIGADDARRAVRLRKSTSRGESFYSVEDAED